LSAAKPFLTLDYGTETAGFAFYNISSFSAPAQIEVKYAEKLPALSAPQSDGPWTFTNGLSNTLRIENFNITDPGRLQSFFVQGGQRWQTIRLLTNGSMTFSSLGINSTAAHVEPANLPGKFSTSNNLYTEIFDIGRRAVEAACVDAGNAPSTWEITPNGAFIRGQQTAQYAAGTSFANYTLAYQTRMVRGGTGWRVASTIAPYGAAFVLTSSYPEESTFAKTNRTLMPPNTLAFN
jgi:hypothetical protein